MDQRFCQSCGMPLTKDVLGTNADGTKNEDYCMYCYKDGKFLQAKPASMQISIKARTDLSEY